MAERIQIGRRQFWPPVNLTEQSQFRCKLWNLKGPKRCACGGLGRVNRPPDCRKKPIGKNKPNSGAQSGGNGGEDREGRSMSKSGFRGIRWKRKRADSDLAQA